MLQGSSSCVKLFTFATKHFSGQADPRTIVCTLVKDLVIVYMCHAWKSVYDHVYMCKDNFNRQHVVIVPAIYCSIITYMSICLTEVVSVYSDLIRPTNRLNRSNRIHMITAFTHQTHNNSKCTHSVTTDDPDQVEIPGYLLSRSD